MKRITLRGLRRRLALLTRPLRHAIAVPLLEAIRLTAQALPHGAGLRLGRAAGALAARLARKKRRLARRQLEQAGIAHDPAALRRLSGAVFEQLGMGAVETLQSLGWPPEQIRDLVGIDNPSLLDPARPPGSALILLTAHMGNWELLPRAYHAHTGRTLTAVMAPQTNDLVTRWLIRQRQSGGQARLLGGCDALTIMRHLRGGGNLIMVADQDSTRSRGIFVDFFGRPAYTPAGPAHLARRAGAVLLPVVIVRDPANPGRHRLLVADPIRPEARLDEAADIQRMTQAYTNVLEDWIRQYPTQWVWIHDRWRHRPGQKVRIRGAHRRP